VTKTGKLCWRPDPWDSEKTKKKQKTIPVCKNLISHPRGGGTGPKTGREFFRGTGGWPQGGFEPGPPGAVKGQQEKKTHIEKRLGDTTLFPSDGLSPPQPYFRPTQPAQPLRRTSLRLGNWPRGPVCPLGRLRGGQGQSGFRGEPVVFPPSKDILRLPLRLFRSNPGGAVSGRKRGSRKGFSKKTLYPWGARFFQSPWGGDGFGKFVLLPGLRRGGNFGWAFG